MRKSSFPKLVEAIFLETRRKITANVASIMITTIVAIISGPRLSLRLGTASLQSLAAKDRVATENSVRDYFL